MLNAFFPLLVASFIADFSGVAGGSLVGSILLIALTSTFLGLLIAVSVSEVFEAQTFSNFIRFPMLFLCGLFIPLERLPVFVRPLSYALPLTYGVDILKASIHGTGHLPIVWDFIILAAFASSLFVVSARNVKRRWIY